VDASIESDATAATEKVGRPRGGVLIGWLVGIGVWFGGAMAAPALVAAGALKPPELVVVFTFVAFFAAIAIGCVVTHSIRSSRHAKAKEERYQTVKQERIREEAIRAAILPASRAGNGRTGVSRA